MSNVFNRLALNFNGLFSLNNLLITRNLRINSLRYLSGKSDNVNNEGKNSEESSSSSSSGESSSDDEKEIKSTPKQVSAKLLIYKNTFVSIEKKSAEKKFVPPTQTPRVDTKIERKSTIHKGSINDETVKTEKQNIKSLDVDKKDLNARFSKPKYEKTPADSTPKFDYKNFKNLKEQKFYNKESSKPKLDETPPSKFKIIPLNLSKPKGTVETKLKDSSQLKDNVGKLAKLLNSKQKIEKTTKELLEPLTKKPETSKQIYNDAKDILSSLKIDESTTQEVPGYATKTKSDAGVKTKNDDAEINRMELIKSILEEAKNFPMDTTRRIPDFSDDQSVKTSRKAKTVSSSREAEKDEKLYKKAKIEKPFEVYQDLKEGQPLNLFIGEAFMPLNTTKESKIWEAFREERLKELTYIPPLNGFEEAIQFTNEGKLWHFPIDNEQGVDNEDYKMPFYEHVLLDHYLDEFPKIKEIQNFMTLILHALSDNPYLTVKEKKETIDWYKNYFSDKIDIIEEAIKVEQYEATIGL